MNDPPAAAVQVEGLVRTFGEVVALDGLDLRVEPGTVLGLLGPNGAGKTTLIKILATLLSPSAGRASVLGMDVATNSLAVRRRIGLAGQFAAIDPELTGQENVEMIARLYRLPRPEARRRTEDVLERFGLTDVAHRRASSYSGGMRRRLDLAAGLIGRPPVVLLDEPTTGLDPRSRQELWLMVEQLRYDGSTVLLTTQYLDEADRLAQRIALVDHGRIVAEGTPGELKRTVGDSVLSVRLADPQTLDAALELLAAASVGYRPAPAVDTEQPDEIRLTVRTSSASVDALRLLDRRRIAITSIELREPSLDDVFLALTGHSTGAHDQPERLESE